jgi:cold shock CspA family protein/uncharacterized LabA/DUF88 family protein
MSSDILKPTARIGVFSDGNFFLHVSKYYNYAHKRRARISIQGLHQFIRHQVALELDIPLTMSQIVDAHYFRGRLNAQEAREKDQLLYHERVFDDILMSSGVTTHYLPLKSGNRPWQEKGIDVWLALEAFEMSFYKRFTVLVLIAGDGDYVPLIRKLNAIGTRVMVLGWDISTVNESGYEFNTRTSDELMDEAVYPIRMDRIVDESSDEDVVIQELFVPSRSSGNIEVEELEVDGNESGMDIDSRIQNIKEGYGFIHRNPTNIFFHFSAVDGVDFNQLSVGDNVRYDLGSNDRGEEIAMNVRLIGE